MRKETSAAGIKWNKTNWRELEKWLAANGFALGWSSATWNYLDRPIQARWEMQQ